MAAASCYSEGGCDRGAGVLMFVYCHTGMGRRQSTISQHHPGVRLCNDDSRGILPIAQKTHPVTTQHVPAPTTLSTEAPKTLAGD